MNHPSPSIHQAAVTYAFMGWPVFPLRPHGKEPLTAHGLKDATTDKSQIDDWWDDTPWANVGIRTGDAFDVLDLDGPAAVETFRQWCIENDVDPESLRRIVSKTSKGWHYLFRPTGLGNRARLLGAPIDWRGAGGYIVAPPSRHPSGAVYEWAVFATPMDDDEPAVNVGHDLPDVPRPWVDVLNPPRRVPLAPTVPRTTFADDDHDRYFAAGFSAELQRVKEAREGERNVILFGALCNVLELVNAGLSRTAIEDICAAGRASGLPDAEVERTLQSAITKVGDTARDIPARPARATVSQTSTTAQATPPAPEPGSIRPSPAVYQGFIGQCVRELEPWTEADPVGVLASLLSGAGCVIGRGPHAMVSTTRHPLLIWPLLLGRTSSGRKGTAQDAAEALLKVADAAFINANVTGGLSSGEGLIHVVRDPVFEASTEEGKEPKLLDPGVDDKRRWIVETEFAGTMARARREGSSLSAVLRQAWDGKTMATLTRSSIVATGAHVAITAHVTPTEFLARLRDSEIAGGTYNRFLPLLIARSKMLPEAPSPPRELLETLGWELGRRISDARRLSWIGRTEPAAFAWRDIYYEMSKDESDDRLGQFIARAVPYVLRLSVLYALLDGERVVDKHHVDAAAALVRYSIASVRVILRTPEETVADRLTAALVAAGGEGMTRTDVNRLFSGRLTAGELDDALARVPGLEVHRIPREGGPGRPTVLYVVPPAEEFGADEHGH